VVAVLGRVRMGAMPDDRVLESAPPTIYQRGEGCVKLTVQVVLHADDGTEAVVREVFTAQREESPGGRHRGLQLAETKDLLAAVQDTLVSHQVSTALSAQVGCRTAGQRGGTRTAGPW